MNIEQEKKALETALASIYTEGKEESHPIFCDFVKRRFENGEHVIDPTILKVWLAAKEHAKEMAKPAVVIEPGVKYNTFSVKKPKGQAFRNIQLGFTSLDDATEWAKTNGYRVIE